MGLGVFSPESAVKAVWDQWVDIRLFYARIPGSKVLRTPEVSSVLCPVKAPVFNSVFETDAGPEKTAALIADQLARYRRTGASMNWWLGPGSRPEDLEERLLRAGLEPLMVLTGMAADLNLLPPLPAPPPDIRVGPLEAGDLPDWLALILRQFHFADVTRLPFRELFQAEAADPQSPYRHFAAKAGDRIIATSSVKLLDGWSGLNYIATDPDYGRRGLGSLMTNLALRQGLAEGFPLGVLQATAEGAPIYRRLGFEEVCRIKGLIYRPQGGQGE